MHDQVSSNPSLGASVQDLSKSYGDGVARVVAVDHVSTSFDAGQMTTILGASGSGKSTLLHCMAGFDMPDTGTSTLCGVHVQDLNPNDRAVFRRTTLGFIFQQHGLIPILTCRENILLSSSLSNRAFDNDRFDDIVQRLGLSDRLEHLPSELSGGQQQKTAIARVMMQRPSILLADEPTGSLDVESSHEVLSLLRGMVDDLGITMIMVTHSIDAALLSDVSVIISDGHITDRLEHPDRNALLDAMRKDVTA
jgi:putative ABC transport system ATP-binding protein